MTNGLATTFKDVTSLVRNEPLTDEQLYRVAPSIFAEKKHFSRSERYAYIPTKEVLTGLKNEGFLPFAVAQSRSRTEDKQEFTKHMLRLRKADLVTAAEAFEVVLVNSHDGTSCFQLMAGIFRFVCHNGMVIGDTIEDIRVQHRGNITSNVIEAAYEILGNYDTAQSSIESMKSLRLLPGEQEAFARAALSLKYDEKSPVTPKQILVSHRCEDDKSDLWTTFNKVQENLLKGGQRGRTVTNKKTTTRPVKSIDNNIKLNKALWILAESMNELKAQAV